ncbi:hypothetical protein [Microbispora sp. ATCC PTA-5024]|uniref:hypothetical protein n=1 Tax=Microbispora sp. ATCC PTA-5024 TaxID=316330 RepID=UPI0003DD8564|nr:hypothetical protein [Microbispora sp. ATCC PTA-5024]ETK32779.1 hypothetical protein MPTA5024_27895 [Microbispora sp. ATCC PTA-5024]
MVSMTVRAKALITLFSAEKGGLSHELPSRTQSLVICARTSQHGARPGRPFAAAITSDDQEPLVPGERLHVVTITTSDEGAVDYLGPGERFRLWCGHDIGFGIVSRRVI